MDSRSMRSAMFVATLAALVAVLAFAGRAEAAQEITEFSTGVTSTQAGGHPDVEYTVTWTNRFGTDLPCDCEDARRLDMHFPTGFIGNPHSVPVCTLSEFSLHICAPESQVGVLDIVGSLREAVFNLTPHPNEAGLVGFYVPGAETALFVVLHARTDSDYGLDATTSVIYHLLPINNITLHLWGVPAASSHDANRFPAGKTDGVECKPYPGGCFGPVESNATPAPYLQNPTTCGVPLRASHSVEYYTGTVVTAEDDWPMTTGCDQLAFDPSLTATPTTSAADTTSGLDVTLRVPQTQSPTAPSPSEIRQVTMKLPPGFSLAPNGANGKTACADRELSFDTEAEAHCPEFAKIGTATVDSSALPAPIAGGIYIGEPQPGQTYRAFLTADGFATHVKLKGSVEVDPQTGRIETTFADLPQSPIQGIGLHFFGSERGIFATPPHCGSYPVTTRFVPWDASLADQVSVSNVVIDSGPNGGPCPGASRPFEPRQRAGTADNSAGAFAPFTFELERDDGDQNLTGLSVSTPPGFLASLRGVSYCPASALGSLLGGGLSGLQERSGPSCPASSRVGSVLAGAGPGTRPVYVSGDAYLAGPYRGAPVSLLTVLPALSGPYDLGNVVVRVAVYVDRGTSDLTAVADPLPTVLGGIPLRTRSLRITLDRRRFTLNPTSCDPFAVESTVSGGEGAVALLRTHFQAASCSSLGFEPSLRLKLTGGLKALAHPAIHAILRPRPDDANLSRVAVTLPPGELVDNDHVGTVCTRVQFAASRCPAGSRIGHASVLTPLLDDPIAGPVWLRSSNRKLPDVVMDLRGQINLELVGHVDSVNGRLRTTFSPLPDAPVSLVRFDLLGGQKGLLVNSEGLCGHKKRLTVSMAGQNGDARHSRPRLQAQCKAGASARKGRG
jgi:hypothetical protein